MEFLKLRTRPSVSFEIRKTLARDVPQAFLSFPSFDLCVLPGNEILNTPKTVEPLPVSEFSKFSQGTWAGDVNLKTLKMVVPPPFSELF